MVWLALLLLCWGASTQAMEADVAGARDPLGIPRFPHSWIVEYQNDDEVLARDFVVSRVDKTRRDVRAESKLRVEARQVSATYRIAEGTPRQEVINHYVSLLDGDTLFVCEGRDCGRSNHWANYVFQQAILYGPDLNQFYIAVEYQQHLVAVYVVERGNRRVYAHVLVMQPEAPLDGPVRLTGGLSRKGFVVLAGAEPLADGRIPPAGEAVLGQAAAELARYSGQQIYVVCHVYGASEAQRLLDASERCSKRAVQLLATQGGPTLVAFGAGPMLPRSAVGSRIELVLPPRMREE